MASGLLEDIRVWDRPKRASPRRQADVLSDLVTPDIVQTPGIICVNESKRGACPLRGEVASGFSRAGRAPGLWPPGFCFKPQINGQVNTVVYFYTFKKSLVLWSCRP